MQARRPPSLLRISALAALVSAACADGGPTSVLPPGPTSGVSAIAIGIHHGCGIVAGEGAFCWGLNLAGELGNGTRTTTLTPVRVAGGAGFVALTLAAGYGCALEESGAAWCWGSGARGALGTGDTSDRTVPGAVVGGLTGFAVPYLFHNPRRERRIFAAPAPVEHGAALAVQGVF